ncbi:dipeptidase [Curtobacterium sp. MCBD17_035]|uniref:dipeptidase n=1 Tax=Curtobacterium sp. MCBD17_035 TaxID=2175673 RepID=UPI000DAA084E|nr:dipeptidase [Curtobacterium sp. MCBD17_035]WIB68176.1 dipeptidase [Curtobacterium sp. MCBD17_035]
MTDPLATLSFPVIDGHNDLPWECQMRRGSSVEGVDGTALTLHTDLPKLRAGGVVGQFWSVYVDVDEPDPVRTTLQQIDLVHRLITRYPDDLRLARTADEVRAAVSAGRIASLLGAEGGHAIGDDLAVLRTFARLGVRYMTLTHTADTAWADSATGERAHGGLTDRGREVVAEMERIGMLVDLSHTSPDTMRDTLDVATAPVLFSHSSTIAVNDHPRNVPDDVLARLTDNGGVVMITFVPAFVSAAWAAWEAADPASRPADGPIVTVADVADHVDHARQVAGIEHVGLGGDYDGTPVLPPDLRDVSRYPVLADELRRRGWSDDDLRALAGGNVLRVLAATDAAFVGG